MQELQQMDELNTSRITRILTSDFPMYFAVVTRVRQEVHCVGPEGGVILSSVVPRVQVCKIRYKQIITDIVD